MHLFFAHVCQLLAKIVVWKVNWQGRLCLCVVQALVCLALGRNLHLLLLFARQFPHPVVAFLPVELVFAQTCAKQLA